MTERKKKSFRRFHFKSGIERFLCYLSSGKFLFFQWRTQEGMRRPKKFLERCWQRHSSRMHVIKNFPGDFTLDPSIAIPCDS